ncbi:poly-gamma-glutamate hydrolase family protein [Actinoplanes sp. NPDC051470]|uniref:poly-gamma-glutamate hydrolase family protein n=1 Tax=Actinoplanes sp. NPDC051470 TaxID=3157224 RepID=UPI003438AA39
MGAISRRRALLALGGTAAVAGGLEWMAPGVASAADDAYPSNTALYADPALTEGVDYGRRYRRHAASQQDQGPFPQTTILALHGGGIELGTSELGLAVAGYHPATMAATAPAHDYWMFEGLRRSGNSELHVTATHCDDPVAVLLAAGATRVVSLHGCTTQQAGLPANTQAVLVGGLDATLKGRLLTAFQNAGVQAVDAADATDLGGTDPRNICNRTFTGAGAQLELTTPLRDAMFGTNTAAERKNTTTDLFWRFVAATRTALS